MAQRGLKEDNKIKNIFGFKWISHRGQRHRV